jgi:ammonia channel protein AmtB
VAVCAGADILAPWAAALTGVVAAAIFIISKALVEKLRSETPYLLKKYDE